MQASNSQENAPIEVVFKTSDGKLIQAAPNFIEFSHLVSDLMQIQLEVQQNEPIDLAQIHSQVLEQINILVQKIESGKFKGIIPIGKYDDALWNKFTVNILNMLIKTF
jgi:hypothetical protein